MKAYLRLVAIAALAACSQPDVADADLAVEISALSAADVVNVHVTVSGPGIANIDADLVQVGTVYRGTIGGIPAGSGRVFTGDATDASGVVIFHGQSAPVTIVAGQTALVDLQLAQTVPPDPFRNHAPVIDSLFVSAQAVAPGDAVSFVASAHDDDGDPLTVTWSGSGTFDNPASQTPVWTAPSVEGIYPVTVTVTDPFGAFDTVTVSIDVHAANARGAAAITATINTSPIVDDITLSSGRLDLGATAALDATAFDPDGDPLTYTWSDDCNAVIAGTGSAPLITAPASATQTSCTVHLVIDDGRGATNFGDFTFALGPATTPESPPVIDTTFQSIDTADNSGDVVLRATAHDPDGGSVVFVWSASVGAIVAETDGAGTTDVTWQAPSCFLGSATVTLAVTDDEGEQATATFTVSSTATSCAPVIDSSSSYSPFGIGNARTVVFDVYAHDPLGGSVAFQVQASTGAVLPDSHGGAAFTEVSWQAPTCFIGTAEVDVLVSDTHGNTTVVPFQVQSTSTSCPPSGLVDWWTGDSTLWDSRQSAPLAGTWVTTNGYRGNGFHFDGTQTLSASVPFLPFGGADRTLEMWVRIEAGSSGETFLGGYGAFGTNAGAYELGELSNNTFFFSSWGPGISGGSVPVGLSNHHVAVTNTGTFLTLYIDGVAVASGNAAINTQAGNLILGRLDSFRHLTGMVDEVRIYNRALTATEIASIAAGNTY